MSDSSRPAVPAPGARLGFPGIPWVLGYVAASAAVLLALAFWVDKPVMLALIGWSTPRIRSLGNVLSEAGGRGDVHALIGLGLYGWSYFGLSRGWACPLRAGFERMLRAGVLYLSTLAVGGIVLVLLRGLVSRARPELLRRQDFFGLGAPFSGSPYDSFPSSHTFAAFAAAFVIGKVAPRWRWPALFCALLVAAGRLMMLKHYPADVAGSALLALLVATCLAPLALNDDSRLVRRLRPRRSSSPA